MGFFDQEVKNATGKLTAAMLDTLHEHQCNVCPLNRNGPLHPQMAPTGAKHPLVYVLGEAPGAQEDKQGIQFVGPSGEYLRSRVPRSVIKRIRWNNCVRTRPNNNETPNEIMLECCRPSVVKDIERSKPKAIFGFGATPLNWALKRSDSIGDWRGRRVPVKIGRHTCWYYAYYHPAFILRMQGEQNWSMYPLVFDLDLRRAWAELGDLPEPWVDTPKEAERGVKCYNGNDFEELLNRIKRMSEKKLVGMDYETNGERPYEEGAMILSAALSASDGTISFAMDHPGSQWTRQQKIKIKAALKEFMLVKSCRKAAHHAAFEIEWSAYLFGKEVVHGGSWACTMSQAFVLDERQGCLSLDFLCRLYFGLSIKSLNPVDVTNLANTPIEKVLTYNGVDSKYHRKLYIEQKYELKRHHLLPTAEHHMSRVPALVLTQMEGIPVDQKRVKELRHEYEEHIATAEQQLKRTKTVQWYEKTLHKPFRATAPKDAQHCINKFYEKPDVGSGGEDALETINDEFSKLVIDARKAHKVLSTYIMPMDASNPESKIFPDGLMHPTTSVNRTVTSRTSANDPNYQNYPRKNDEAKRTRSAVKPGGDLRIVSFDYGQIQARNIAMESHDGQLIRAFRTKYDIHSDWCEKIAQAFPHWVEGGARALRDQIVKKKKRDEAKNLWVFPSFFGASHRTLAGYLGIPEVIAERLAREFWREFPGVRSWHNHIRRTYEEFGYVSSLAGYLRRAPIGSTELINAPIQADEAKIVLDALIRLSKLDYKRYQPCMLIHDDLTFIIPKHEVEKRAEVIVQTMLDCPFDWAKVVPLTVEMSVGVDWESKQATEVFSS